MSVVSGTKPRLLLLLLIALCCTTARAATQAPDRAEFPDSIKAVPAATPGAAHAAYVSRAVLSADETSASMTFEVALRMRNFDEMQARIARGELISDTEKAVRYFPLPADHDRIVQWLAAQGLEVTRTDSNHLAVFGRGSVGAVGRAFHVAFARVAVKGDGEYTSAVTAPSLPADVSPIVLGIHGLQPHIKRRPLSTPRALHPNINLSGYLPAQIASAYNATGLSVTGAGQTIAIYAFAFPKDSDLTSFWSAAGGGQTTSNVQTVNVAGGPASSPSDNSLEEAALDVEWAGALAPGATIRIYGANENDPAENDEILQQVYADLPSQPNLHVLNICIGGNERDVPRDYLIIEAQYMANLASAGVTVLVASGDNGAVAEGVVQTTYPTSDPDVTGVGGTTLTLSSNNSVTSETAWPGSGGGISIAFSRPSWQTGPGIGTGSTSGTMRLVPDVAAPADPEEGGMVVYDGGQVVIGGTSWATPVWSAFCALINQKRGTPLGLLNPKIYSLIGTSSFRDITTGGNGTYGAGPGYDLLTGIGVPDVSALLADTLSSSLAASIAGQLVDRVVTTGQPALFFVVGAGATPLSYQWQRLPEGSTVWANLMDGGSYSGSGTQGLLVTGTTSQMTGDQFRCAVSNSSGSATSPAATLTVNTVGVTTLAGWPGSAGSANGTGWAARFANPGGVRADGNGNIYVSDSSNYTIRKVTAAGVVTTVAGTPGTSGSADGPVATALFNAVGGVAFDSAGNLYVADSGNYTIRKISTAGVVSTLAGVAGMRGETDGTGSQARLYDPQNLAVDSSGNIYVADGNGDVIRKITPAGVVTTLAGTAGSSGSADGTGTAAQFNDPTGIAVDASANVYVADLGNDTVRKITPAGIVTTIAGRPGLAGSADGTGSAASFNGPAGVGVDSSGNVYVADSTNNTIREINPSGFVTTVAGFAGDTGGVDGLPGNARFDSPGDVTIDPSGIVYVADALNCTIRRVIPGVGSAPYFTAQPSNQSVTLGTSATFTIGVSGTAPFTYQWYFNGSAISGATSPSYTIADVQDSNAGSYSVSVTNSVGMVTSSSAILTISLPAGYPDITAQPQGGTLSGGSLALSVSVTGTGPFSYQWALNGSSIAGATGPTYTATAPGSYGVSVSNSIATTVSSAAFVSAGYRLVNISSRALVGTGGGIAIAGFVVEGPPGETKQVLIRGIGPTLANFGITGTLASPTISLFSGTMAVASNTGWGTNSNAAQIAAVTSQVGAFALASGSADSALLANLLPGPYSVELSGVGSTTGVGLLEIYEANTADPELLVNISTRAQVGVGDNILIAGFVVRGTQPAKVLIRGIGPALSAFGVTGYLAQPILTVVDNNGNAVGTNTGWGANSNAADIVTAASEVGAFGLTTGSADSALLLTLNPGLYTAEVTGADNSTGVALAEVYQVPP